MEGHDNMQQPTGRGMNEVNQALEQGGKRVTLHIDIWYLVFKQVVKIYQRGAQSFSGESERKLKKWLLPFRLLSRGFYEVITPIVYFHVDLERGCILPKLALKEEPLVAETFEENILNHARELVLDNYDYCDSDYALELQTAEAELVARCKRLKSVMWAYTDRDSQGQLASLYLHSFLQNTRGCHFFGDVNTRCCHIKELKLGNKYKTDESRKSKTASLESNQALENRISDLRLRSTSTTEIKASLGQRNARPELEALVVDLAGALFYTFEQFGAKFPAMERLTLKGYTWDHAQSGFEHLWDFSRLHSLSLEGRVVNFLKNAPINQLTQLHFLKLSSFSEYMSRSTNTASVQKLLGVLLEGLKNLDKLIIEDNNWHLYTPIDAVLALGGKLQRLDLRPATYKSFVFQGETIEVISVVQLVQLRTCCPNLAFLCLSLSVFSCEVDEFLNVLSQFEQLGRLMLYAVSSLAPQGVSNGLSDDADFDGARAIMTKMHAQKVGLQFYSIEIHLHQNGHFNVIRGRESTRFFASTMSVSGVYQQWGSSRKVARRMLAESASN